MAFVGIHHLALSVRDRNRSQTFYQDVLGFQPMMELDEAGHRVLLLKHEEMPLVIGLHQHGQNPGDSFSEFSTGMDHIAIGVDSRDSLDEWQQRFADSGVEHSPVAPGARAGASVLVFRDPDNIQLELIHFPSISAP
ncbi:MAG: VOC family protein [Acidimicrobiales bacterium]